MEQLFQKIDQEKENRFKKQWVKLDKGSKLNRLLLYVKMQKAENNLSEKEENILKTLLLQLHNSNVLNKSSDVEYDIEKSIIIKINNLTYDEDSKKYIFSKSEKKMTKKNSSQNSNIERHFNRSKKSSKTF
jgi:hypothetical protein